MFLRICQHLKCSCSGQEFLCLNSPRAGLYKCHSQTPPSIADFLPPTLLAAPVPHLESSVICCAVRKLLCQFCDIMVLTRALWCFFFFSLSRLTFSSSYTSSRSSCPNWGLTKWDILTTSSGGCPTVKGLTHPKVKCLALFIPNLYEFLLLQYNTKDVLIKHTVSGQ